VTNTLVCAALTCLLQKKFEIFEPEIFCSEKLFWQIFLVSPGQSVQNFFGVKFFESLRLFCFGKNALFARGSKARLCKVS